MRYWKFLALPILIAALLSIPRSATPQVSINVGAEPNCPYGYSIPPHTPVRHTGTTGPNGSTVRGSIGAGPGSTAPTISTAT